MKLTSTTVATAAVMVAALAIPTQAAYTQDQLDCYVANDCINSSNYCLDTCFNMTSDQITTIQNCAQDCESGDTSSLQSCAESCDDQLKGYTGLDSADFDAMALAAESGLSSSIATTTSSSTTDATDTATTDDSKSTTTSDSSITMSPVSSSVTSHTSSSGFVTSKSTTTSKSASTTLTSDDDSTDDSDDIFSDGTRVATMMPGILTSVVVLTYYMQ
ncbi:hypothetical protein H4R33_006961 [Dimargaris cristalligena]|nr:hypothetical protein H4R33_006961 [Dimargaris cristalligena]